MAWQIPIGTLRFGKMPARRIKRHVRPVRRKADSFPKPETRLTLSRLRQKKARSRNKKRTTGEGADHAENLKTCRRQLKPPALPNAEMNETGMKIFTKPKDR
jgi:hypothetical protein